MKQLKTTTIATANALLERRKSELKIRREKTEELLQTAPEWYADEEKDIEDALDDIQHYIWD